MHFRPLFKITTLIVNVLFFACASLQAASAPGDTRLSREAYIAQYREDAIREMKKSGVPASITLAQGCLESSDGKSPLAVEANNHFGIKCANWNGPGFYQDDDAPNECFRKYNSAYESYADHSDFLKTRPRYASLFELESTDYKSWAHGLKRAGYATDPNYAHRLIKIIEEFNLHQYDLAGVTEDAPLASVDKKSVPLTPKRNISGRVFVPATEPVNVFTDRQAKTINGTSYIIARRGDTFKSLSEELQLGYWQLPKYNELSMNASLKEGQIIYITPKQRSAQERIYVVKAGDTIHSVSQQLAVKSKFICKYNQLQENQPLREGQQLIVGL
jgi:LysM repeat protein